MKFAEISKSDLYSGMILVCRNGEKRRLINGELYGLTCVSKISAMGIYKEDLTNKMNSDFDIVKVYMPLADTYKFEVPGDEQLNCECKYELIWERVEKVEEEKYDSILTDEEREYLAAVIKPVRDRVMYIELAPGAFEYVHIDICLNNDDSILLFDVSHEKMFRNMRVFGRYTLEELKL